MARSKNFLSFSIFQVIVILFETAELRRRQWRT